LGSPQISQFSPISIISHPGENISQEKDEAKDKTKNKNDELGKKLSALKIARVFGVPVEEFFYLEE